MDVLADLGTGADGSPGVDHGAFVHVGADVDVGRHQDHVLGEEGPTTGHRWWYHPHTHGPHGLGREALEFGGHLVEELELPTGDRCVIGESEGEQDRLFNPLVNGPTAAELLGHAHLASIECIEHGLNRFTNVSWRIGGVELGAVFPSGIDGGFELAWFMGTPFEKGLVGMRSSQ